MKLAAVTAKYIGKQYKEYGCIERVDNFMRDIGRPLPPEINGINAVNYIDLVRADIKNAQYTMIRTFRKIGVPASTKYPAIGDLLVVWQPVWHGIFPAVAVGNGQAIASFIRKGVILFQLNRLNLPIMARRVE